MVTSVVLPEDAGNSLGAIVLRQLPNLDRWDWGRLEPRVYFGNYSLRGKGARGLARAVVSAVALFSVQALGGFMVSRPCNT